MIKEKVKSGTIIVLIVIIIILLMLMISVMKNNRGYATAYIEKAAAEDMTDNTTGSIRIKMNPEVTIKNGVMQDLNFANCNESRYLVLKISVNGEYVYNSGYVQAGDIVVGDFVTTDTLKKGSNDALGEVYSYDLNKKYKSQTNVEMHLNY